MTIDADIVLDRKRLKRHIGVWRGVAIGLTAVLVMVLLARQESPFRGDSVARLTVAGVIVTDPARDEALAELASDPNVKALIVRIDSPGGTFVGGESLNDALSMVADAKPVVAVMDDLATSAGYMVAIAADRVLARRSTVTGSIGVLWQTADLSGLLAKLGISAEAIRSGPLKGQPSPLEPMRPEVRRSAQSLIDEMHGLFVDMVAAARHMSEHEVRALADGRLFSGKGALDARLIDGIGGEREARAWLAAERGVGEDLPVYDVEVEDDVGGWLRHVLGDAGKTFFPETLTLDGVLAVWHPGLS
jgi:protease-4